jgi:hypothetical protein
MKRAALSLSLPFVPAQAGTQFFGATTLWPLGPRVRGDERINFSRLDHQAGDSP